MSNQGSPNGRQSRRWLVRLRYGVPKNVGGSAEVMEASIGGGNKGGREQEVL